MGSLIVIIAMFALLWLLLIRPQRARQQEQQRMIDNVDVGDEILTSGGLIAVVRGVDDDANELHVEIAPGIEVRMDRRAVGAIVTKDEAGAEDVDEDEEGDGDAAGEAAEREDDEATVNAQGEPGDGEAVEPDRRYPGTPA